MLTASGPKAVRKPEELFLVDRVQHGDHRALDDFIFQSGDAQRALFSSRLRYVPSPDRQCPVRSSMDPCVQVLEIVFQFRLVVLPRQAIHSRCGFALERIERFP